MRRPGQLTEEPITFHSVIAKEPLRVYAVHKSLARAPLGIHGLLISSHYRILGSLLHFRWAHNHLNIYGPAGIVLARKIQLETIIMPTCCDFLYYQ